MSRELDAEIATALFGEPRLNAAAMMFQPKYSTDIDAAWRVVEKMREQRWTLSLNNEAAVWDATFCREPDHENRRGAYEAVDAQAPTAPEAICRAALAALNPEQPSPELLGTQVKP